MAPKDRVESFSEVVNAGQFDVRWFKELMGKKWRYREGNEKLEADGGVEQDVDVEQLIWKYVILQHLKFRLFSIDYRSIQVVSNVSIVMVLCPNRLRVLGRLIIGGGLPVRTPLKLHLDRDLTNVFDSVAISPQPADTLSSHDIVRSSVRAPAVTLATFEITSDPHYTAFECLALTRKGTVDDGVGRVNGAPNTVSHCFFGQSSFTVCIVDNAAIPYRL
jgi:hypothetical protein